MLLGSYKTWVGDTSMECFIIKKKNLQGIIDCYVSDCFPSERELSQPTICYLQINSVPTKVWARKAKMTTAIKERRPGAVHIPFCICLGEVKVLNFTQAQFLHLSCGSTQASYSMGCSDKQMRQCVEGHLVNSKTVSLIYALTLS